MNWFLQQKIRDRKIYWALDMVFLMKRSRMIERDAFSYLEMVRSLVRFLFRTLSKRFGNTVGYSFWKSSLCFDFDPFWIRIEYRVDQNSIWPCLFHKLDQKLARNVRGIGEAYHNVSRSATKDVIEGHTLDVHYGRHKDVQYVFCSSVQFQYSSVQFSTSFGSCSFVSIHVSAHLVSHLELNLFDQFQEFYVWSAPSNRFLSHCQYEFSTK